MDHAMNIKISNFKLNSTNLLLKATAITIFFATFLWQQISQTDMSPRRAVICHRRCWTGGPFPAETSQKIHE